jgi:heterodisulfide reductase subunit C
MSRDKIYPDYQFLEEVEKDESFQAGACFLCRKCTNGCPVTFALDLFPDEVIRMVLLGQRERVLHCQTIWVCAACETCTTRCPNEVKIAELMDHLKEMAIEEQVPCPQPAVLALHKTFISNVQKRGRVFESTLLPAYLLRSGQLRRKWKDGSWQTEAKLGWKLFSKGRMPVLPRKRRGTEEVRQILKRSK